MQTQMVLLVLNDPTKCMPVLRAWETVGVGGATVINTTGMGRLKQFGIRDDFPLMPSLADFFTGETEVHHRTIFSIIHDEALIDRLVDATESVTGSLDNPHTGMLVVLPVSRVVGMYAPEKQENAKP